MPRENRVYAAAREAKRKRKAGRPSRNVPTDPASVSLHYPAPEWAKVLNIYIRNTDSKAQAAVMRINVLEQHIEKLTAAIDKLSAQVFQSNQFILRLLDDPEARRFAEFVAKDVAFSNLPNHTS